MPAKFKPSMKKYNRVNGRSTGEWEWQHYYLKQTPTEEILRAIEFGRPRDKNKLVKELERRGCR